MQQGTTTTKNTALYEEWGEFKQKENQKKKDKVKNRVSEND